MTVQRETLSGLFEMSEGFQGEVKEMEGSISHAELISARQRID